MESIPDHYKDSVQKILVHHAEIQNRIKVMADEILSRNLNREIKIICVLKGAYRFSNDLVNVLYLNNFNKYPITIEFVRVKSYVNTESTHQPTIDDINYSLYDNKNVIICEDIIDTGNTIHYLTKQLFENCKNITLSVASLFMKKDTTNDFVVPDYVGFEIPNEFIVGYGLDYNEMFRDMDHVCVINDHGIEKYKA